MTDETVVALPVQLIQVPGGVIVKRGLEEILLSGKGTAAAVAGVLARAGSEDGARLSDLRALIESNWQEVDAAALIAELREKRMLVGPEERPRGPESPNQVLAWSAGSSAKACAAGFAAVSISVIGVNTVSRRLLESLTDVGAAIVAVDDPDLRNVRLFTAEEALIGDAWGTVAPLPFDAWEAAAPQDGTTCLVVCSDFGGLQQFADWNLLAYERGWSFLPVVLQNAVGFVGPFVFPGETACFACMLDRENANSQTAEMRRAAETFAFEGQTIAAYHPSMASALADVAAVELTKQFGYGWTSAAIGNVIEVNLLTASVKTRPILKAPRCTVCSPLRARGFVGYTHARS